MPYYQPMQAEPTLASGGFESRLTMIMKDSDGRWPDR